jgi:CheY-like chemotaxis protein
MMAAQPKILIVDDDPIFRAIAIEALSVVTPHLAEAENGEAAFRLLCAGSADLVLTDINMPKRDGLELIGDIRARWPQTAIIAVTAGSRAAAPDLLLKTAALLGAYVITKPIAAHALVELVSKALGLDVPNSLRARV